MQALLYIEWRIDEEVLSFKMKTDAPLVISCQETNKALIELTSWSLESLSVFFHLVSQFRA